MKSSRVTRLVREMKFADVSGTICDIVVRASDVTMQAELPIQY